MHYVNPSYIPAPEPPAGISGATAKPVLTPSRVSRRVSWCVLGAITLLYVAVCFAPVIFDDNEGLYAGAVREMHASGNWLVPTMDGLPRVQKPPLVYWTMLASTSLLGQNEFALRLPNALATAGWIVATYLIMRRLGGERFGLAAAVVLASMLGVWVFNHLVQPEPFLACFISLAIWCLVEARVSARPDLAVSYRGPLAERFPGDSWYLLFWMFLGLGAMSKGLHGALWPLGTVALAALVAPGARPWLRPVLSARGMLVFLLLLAPWYTYMAARFPHFLSAHFINEQLGASLNTRFPPDAKQLPLLQFYGQHLLFWMPWTLLLPGSIYVAVRATSAARHGVVMLAAPTSDIVKLLACWAVLTLVTVAFSTRQDYYSMSCWGVVAGFLALPWTGDRLLALRLPRAYTLVPCLLMLLAGVAAIALVAWVEPKQGALGAASAAPIRERDTFMDAIEGISPGLWGHFLVLLLIFGGTMVVAGLASALLCWRRQAYAALLVLAAAMAVPICLATAGFAMMGPYFSLAPEAARINAEIARPDRAGATVACEALPHTASSLLYYLHAPIRWVNAPVDQDYAQRVLGLGRDNYWDDGTLLRAWKSGAPVYLIIEQDRQDYWKNVLPPGARVVCHAGTRLVLCNR